MRVEEIVKLLTEDYGLVDVEVPRPRRIRARIPQDLPEEKKGELLRKVLEDAKDWGFQHMSFMTCVDFIKDGRFELNYGLWSYTIPALLVIKYDLDRENPKHFTVVDIWRPAKIYEQEIHEMFGVEFEGNPRSYEPYVLEDWDDIPPLRKDFDPLKYLSEHPLQGTGYEGLPLEALMQRRYDGGDENADS